MFLYLERNGGQVYKVLATQPDGMTFLCRRYKIDPEGKGVPCTYYNEVTRIEVFADHMNDEEFMNASLYEEWDDFMRDDREIYIV